MAATQKGVRGAASGTPSAPLQIDLYDEITSWSVRSIVDRLRAAPEAEVLLRINSPGGDVLEGFALANALKSHAGRKIAVVEGLAASAATFPLCACDEVRMHPESMIMVHAPWQRGGMGAPGAEELEEQAEVLRKLENLCVGLYQRKTGADEKTVREWMQRDTWMTPQEAQSVGICDEILTSAPNSAARARAARYLARMAPKTKKESKPMAMENDGIPDGGSLPEHLMSKLAKCGMPDGADKDGMMSAYMTYLSTTDDGPAERMEMRKAMEKMSKMADMDEDEPAAKMDDDMDEESSGDKKMSAKLRQSANLDPAVAKLVETLTGQVATMGKKLSGYEATERKRAEESFYAVAQQHTSREDAQEYLALCGGSMDAALKLIQKLPRKAGAMGRWFSGGSPVGGTSAPRDTVERTKTFQTGHNQTTTLHGLALAAQAKRLAKEKGIDLATAQRQVARDRPDLYV